MMAPWTNFNFEQNFLAPPTPQGVQAPPGVKNFFRLGPSFLRVLDDFEHFLKNFLTKNFFTQDLVFFEARLCSYSYQRDTLLLTFIPATSGA